MSCSAGCQYGDCPTYGECLRRKGLQINKHGLTEAGAVDRRKDKVIHEYQKCRREGIQPESWQPKHVAEARKLSEMIGQPYQA